MRRVIGSLAIGMLALAACGGDSDSQEALPEAEFVETADGICAAAAEKIDEELTSIFENAESVADLSEENFATIADVAGGAYEGMLSELRDIAPEDKVDEWNSLLDDLETVTDQLTEDPAEFLASEDNPFAGLDEKAADLGLEVCGA